MIRIIRTCPTWELNLNRVWLWNFRNDSAWHIGRVRFTTPGRSQMQQRTFPYIRFSECQWCPRACAASCTSTQNALNGRPVQLLLSRFRKDARFGPFTGSLSLTICMSCKLSLTISPTLCNYATSVSSVTHVEPNMMETGRIQSIWKTKPVHVCALHCLIWFPDWLDLRCGQRHTSRTRWAVYFLIFFCPIGSRSKSFEGGGGEEKLWPWTKMIADVSRVHAKSWTEIQWVSEPHQNI